VEGGSVAGVFVGITKALDKELQAMETAINIDMRIGTYVFIVDMLFGVMMVTT